MSNAEVEISNHKHCDCFILCFGVNSSFDHFYVSPWDFVCLVLWHATIQSENNVSRITKHINDREEKQKRPFESNKIKGEEWSTKNVWGILTNSFGQTKYVILSWKNILHLTISS